MKELKTEVWHEAGMTCPIDYNYMGELRVLTNKGDERYIQVCHGAFGSFYTVNSISLKDGSYSTECADELFSTDCIMDSFSDDTGYSRWLEEDGDSDAWLMRETAGSAYFPYYLKIEHLLDVYASEVADGTTIAELDDALDRLNYPILKVASDMRGVRPGPVIRPHDKIEKTPEKKRYFREGGTEMCYERAREFPPDNDYYGGIMLEADAGEVLYVQAYYGIDSHGYDVGRKSMKDPTANPDTDVVGCYTSWDYMGKLDSGELKALKYDGTPFIEGLDDEMDGYTYLKKSIIPVLRILS